MKNENDVSAAIPDDIEVVGPGRMLMEAREAIKLTQQQVADKLNFRVTLVQDIETEQFDMNLPAAFNRGYLRNYAKLVNISQEDVLNSYEQLGVAQRQCDEMQSFSKGTEKQAEHNMLMWITYLILIALISATVVWWYQVPSTQPTAVSVPSVSEISNTSINDDSASNDNAQLREMTNSDTLANQIIDKPSQADNEKAAELTTTILTEQLNTAMLDDVIVDGSMTESTHEKAVENASIDTSALDSVTNTPNSQENIDEASVTTVPANLVFTFSGDCWVNIYDGTGERVAWGVKKSGYIMRFSGQAPFNVTLGKPELVQIEYNDVAVDMTGFNAGNIAKFSLPIQP